MRQVKPIFFHRIGPLGPRSADVWEDRKELPAGNAQVEIRSVLKESSRPWCKIIYTDGCCYAQKTTTGLIGAAQLKKKSRTTISEDSPFP